MKIQKYVGLDVHKDKTTIAIAEGDRSGEVRHYGDISSDLVTTEKTLRKIRGEHGVLHVAYEAGPTGFVLYRRLRQLAIDCIVVAPSRTPQPKVDPKGSCTESGQTGHTMNWVDAMVEFRAGRIEVKAPRWLRDASKTPTRILRRVLSRDQSRQLSARSFHDERCGELVLWLPRRSLQKLWVARPRLLDHGHSFSPGARDA